jgi:hypothetical protein
MTYFSGFVKKITSQQQGLLNNGQINKQDHKIASKLLSRKNLDTESIKEIGRIATANDLMARGNEKLKSDMTALYKQHWLDISGHLPEEKDLKKIENDDYRMGLRSLRRLVRDEAVERVEKAEEAEKERKKEPKLSAHDLFFALSDENPGPWAARRLFAKLYDSDMQVFGLLHQAMKEPTKTGKALDFRGDLMDFLAQNCRETVVGKIPILRMIEEFKDSAAVFHKLMVEFMTRKIIRVDPSFEKKYEHARFVREVDLMDPKTTRNKIWTAVQDNIARNLNSRDPKHHEIASRLQTELKKY